jgi:ribosomal protein S3AE
LEVCNPTIQKRDILHEVQNIPDLMCIFFSLTYAVSKEAKIVRKGALKIIYNQDITSANGHLLAIKALLISSKEFQNIPVTVMLTITDIVETSKIQQQKKVNINI